MQQQLDIEFLTENHRSIFSQKISEIVDYRKTTLRDLAKLIGKTSNTVANWKHKRCLPSACDVHILSLATEMKMEYFFNNDITPEEGDMTLNREEKVKKDRFRRELSRYIDRLPDSLIPLLLKIYKNINEEIIEKRDKKRR